jgi:hypothetical protein
MDKPEKNDDIVIDEKKEFELDNETTTYNVID